jgi:hypothetical protein
MFEILALIFLPRWIGKLAEKNGFKPLPYQWLTAALWFTGELLGLDAALIILHKDIFSLNVSEYLLAIVGALLGAALAYFLVNHARAINRWLRFATGLTAVIVVFLQQGLFGGSGEETLQRMGAFAIITGGLLFAVFCASYKSLELKGRAIFFGLVAGALIVFGGADLFSAIFGGSAMSETCWFPLIYFAAAGSIIGIVWSLVDGIRNTSV